MPILRSDTQGRILARLLADPDRGYNVSELVRSVTSSMPTVLREVERAELAGIVTTEKIGPTRVVRANAAHPLHGALSQLILATYGPPAVIAAEFEPIEAALAVVLFGSWAARYRGERGRAPNDLDVLMIGSPDRDDVDDAAERAERVLGLPVQATVRSRSQWMSAREAFVQQVKARPLVVVLVDETDAKLADDLRGLAAAGAST
ncbi:MAG: ArsR family transcriptional regulator [Ilumatobacteraceae bacterium]